MTERENEILTIIEWAKSEASNAYKESYKIAHTQPLHEDAEFRSGTYAGRSMALIEMVSKLRKIL